MRGAMWGLLMLCFGCSSSGGGAGAQEAGTDSPAEAPAELDASDGGVTPEGAPDGQPEAAAETSVEAGQDATEEPAPIVDAASPFETGCMGNPAGDGGSYCALYSYATDGAIVDEAGDPTGISVQEACTIGQACTACLGDAIFAGVCF